MIPQSKYDNNAEYLKGCGDNCYDEAHDAFDGNSLLQTLLKYTLIIQWAFILLFGLYFVYRFQSGQIVMKNQV